jgi:hypothetical protein
MALTEDLARRGRIPQQEMTILAGDYHSGPLTTLIPFGIFGLIGLIWFMIAGLRLLYLNRKNGPQELKTVNTFLYAYFISKLLVFWFVFGNFYSDFAVFIGIIGFSISLNHGIRTSPSEAPVEPEPLPQVSSFAVPVRPVAVSRSRM